jgi:hypothetical protein
VISSALDLDGCCLYSRSRRAGNGNAPCYWYCLATWAYDARERLVSENTGTSTSAFALDVAGNVLTQSAPGASASRTYAGLRLQTQTEAGATSRFLYDSLGNQDCRVASAHAGTSCPQAGSPHLLEDWAYDYKSRLLGRERNSSQPGDAIAAPVLLLAMYISIRHGDY